MNRNHPEGKSDNSPAFQRRVRSSRGISPEETTKTVAFRASLSTRFRPCPFIPEGWLRIAQRFNAGIAIKSTSSPEGTAERATTRYGERTCATRRKAAAFRPSLRDLAHFQGCPSVETLGYWRLSLRDRRHRAQLRLCV